jgi:hypothetical protein
MFGELPAFGFFLRHVRGIELNNIQVSFMKDDLRSAFVLHDVKDVDFHHVKAKLAANVPMFSLRDVQNFSAHQCNSLADMRFDGWIRGL